MHRYLFAAVLAASPVTPASSATLFAASGDVASITPTVDAFRDALGTLNAPAPINAPGGRRQINWDAAPDVVSDPNAFPGDFFNFGATPRARGIAFQGTDGTTDFQLSATAASGEPPAFGFPVDLPRFSEERLFATVGGTGLDVLFFDPADQVTPALTRGLGVVFSDVDLAGVTTMQFFDQSGTLLSDGAFDGTATVAPLDRGLSFVGVLFDDPVIARVSINAGNSWLNGAGGLAGGLDFVPMDDFIFGEPTPIQMAPIPLPPAVALMLAGLGALAALRRRR